MSKPEEISIDELEVVNGKLVRKVKAPKPLTAKLTAASEDEVWEECRQRLEQHGFYPPGQADAPPKRLVHGYYLSTQQKRRAKVTPGIPDVLIVLAGVPLMFPAELKERKLKADGTLAKPKCEPEQEELLKSGSNCIVRCAEDIDHIVNSLRRLFQHDQTTRMMQHAANVPSG